MPSKLDSTNDPSRIGYLIGNFITQSLSDEEREELEQWISADPKNMRMFEDMTAEGKVDEILEWVATRQTEERLRAVKGRIAFEDKRAGWWKIAVAASLIIVLCVIAFYFSNVKEDKVEKMAVSQDLLPGSEAAVLQLPGGKVIKLDGIKDTAFEGIKIQSGEIAYHDVSEVALHEVRVPKKGFYTLLLPDGTKVMLNNASSIVYPSRFEGATREVTVTGESYFVVAKDKDHPFIVHSGDMQVRATGTAFNVNGFEQSVALVEGGVTVNESVKLLPGHAYAGGVAQVTDVAAATAWTRNEFKFSNLTLQEIAPLLERWYDCKVILKDAVPDHFFGVISRTVKVSKVMELLQGAGNFNYVINDEVITITK